MADHTPHRGWYSRGYLPHLDEPDRVQSVTLRLADSLPRILTESWSESGTDHPSQVERARQLTAILDRGYGECWLRNPEIADLVERALLHFDGHRYRLLAWCVMPNHLHVMIEVFDGFPLGQLVHSWKSFTAHRANELRGGTGQFWAREYFDRFVRDDKHLKQAIALSRTIPLPRAL